MQLVSNFSAKAAQLYISSLTCVPSSCKVLSCLVLNYKADCVCCGRKGSNQQDGVMMSAQLLGLIHASPVHCSSPAGKIHMSSWCLLLLWFNS